MRAVGDRVRRRRLRALIVLLWRAGSADQRSARAHETDLDRGRGAVLVRHGKGGKRREVGMDRWAWDQLDPGLRSARASGRGAVLRDPRPHRRKALGGLRRAQAAASNSGRRRASVADLRPISCGMLTRSSWPTRASRWSLSSGSSGIMRVIMSSPGSEAGERVCRDFGAGRVDERDGRG